MAIIFKIVCCLQAIACIQINSVQMSVSSLDIDEEQMEKLLEKYQQKKRE